MIPFFEPVRRLAIPGAIALAFTFTAPAASAAKAKAPVQPAAQTTAYAVRNLVSNGALHTPYIDPRMINTWGVAFNPAGLVWVTNNRSGTSTLYDGNGVPDPLVVNVPPAGPSGVGSPTGIVFSGTSDFAVTNGSVSGPSRFIFASDDGLISGWAPNVDLNNAIRVVTTAGADYKGLAIATSSTGARLYAADFRHGRVDMFDSQFRKVTAAGAFVDPTLPTGLVPFGIQAIANKLYVTYTKPDGGSGSNGAPGAGMAMAAAPEMTADAGTTGGGSSVDSVIDIFDSEGKFLRRAVAQSTIKQPWGLALAPADFGKYAGRLLVGDFHDGTIGAYDQNDGKFLGLLADAGGKALKMPGLWGFQFGNGVNSQPTNTLFFAAGPNGQGGGVYGSVTVTTGK